MHRCFEAFLEEPDPAAHPFYRACIPVPVWLTLVVARLRGGYYRAAAALRADVLALAANAEAYNEPDSAVVAAARDLVRGLLAAFDGRSEVRTPPRGARRLCRMRCCAGGGGGRVWAGRRRGCGRRRGDGGSRR